MTNMKKFVHDILTPVDNTLSKLSIGDTPQLHSGFSIGNNDVVMVNLADTNQNTKFIGLSSENKITEPNTISKVITIKKSIPKNSNPEYMTSFTAFTVNL